MLPSAGMVEVINGNWRSLCPLEERGCWGMRSSSRICSFALWFGEHALCQQGVRNIDLEIRRSPVFIIENFSFQGGKGRFLHCQSCRLVFGSCYRLVEMVEAGRNLWMSSYANPQPIYNQLHMSHWILTISKCEESTAPMGNLFQCLVTGFVQSKEKKKVSVFPDI